MSRWPAAAWNTISLTTLIVSIAPCFFNSISSIQISSVLSLSTSLLLQCSGYLPTYSSSSFTRTVSSIFIGAARSLIQPSPPCHFLEDDSHFLSQSSLLSASLSSLSPFPKLSCTPPTPLQTCANLPTKTHSSFIIIHTSPLTIVSLKRTYSSSSLSQSLATHSTAAYNKFGHNFEILLSSIVYVMAN